MRRLAPALRLARSGGLVMLLLLAGMTALSGPAGAQAPFPLPGLGAATGQGPAPEPDPPAGEPAAPAAPEAAPEAPVLQRLIDVLNDDAARAALIRELEAAAAGPPSAEAPPAADGAPPPDGTAPAEGAPAPPADAAPPTTFSERVLALWQGVLARAGAELEAFWSRAQRVPTTLGLSLRAFEEDVLTSALASLLRIALATYVALTVLQLLVVPLRRFAARRALGHLWARRALIRLGVTVPELLAVPLAALGGLLAVAGEGGGIGAINETEAVFLSAFLAVEAARVVVRALLSPRAPALRLFAMPERAIDSLSRIAQALIYLVGFGQLLIVPIVSDGVSVFVGRAVSTVLGAVTVLVLIFYALAKRRAVATWLRSPDETGRVRAALDWLGDRWHWPVLIYLIYVLVVVLTRPGNMLLPLFAATLEVAAVIAAFVLANAALTRWGRGRLRVPSSLGQRLPLLEERLNTIRPAVIWALRLFLAVLASAALVDIVTALDFRSLADTGIGVSFFGRLAGVAIVAIVLATIWLGMSSWVDYRLNPFVGTVPTPREITLLTLLRNAATIAIVVLGLFLSLSEMGMNIGPLLASAGVLGLAISFGAQRMVEDIITGVFIQLENAMNVGDVVDVGGVVGVVEKLTVRSVTLRDLQGVVHMIPFSSAKMVSNYMRDYAYHLADIGVAYREDVEEVRTAMNDAFALLRADPEVGASVLDDLEWFGLNAFGDSALVVRARIKTVPGDQWAVGRAYNGILKRLFDERGIEIPFPHQTIYFGEDKAGAAPPLHIQVERRQAAAAARPEPRHAPPETVAPRTDIPASEDS